MAWLNHDGTEDGEEGTAAEVWNEREAPYSLGLRWRHDLLDSSFLDADAESSTDERRRARDASSLSGHGCEATRAGATLRTEWSKDSEGVVSSGAWMC